ncbi:hypothetical protein [Alkalibacillus almallahensis]|uniref:hypothetical protein n=1 Tax=Alkalibacillus almallahensis TaxID=1379154 RepID=UPI0014215701|nr:hypothetical protein [Alkalibacillus almallahensis]NIK12860.1 hypothetical protein [Alkalibacillus almallahensis]
MDSLEREAKREWLDELNSQLDDEKKKQKEMEKQREKLIVKLDTIYSLTSGTNDKKAAEEFKKFHNVEKIESEKERAIKDVEDSERKERIRFLEITIEQLEKELN